MKTRLFVSETLFNGAEITLTGERARYLGKVLRLRPDDSVCVFDGSGPEWRAAVAAIRKNSVALIVGEESDPGTESSLNVHLVQAVSRGDRMDFVVQKATELGVQRITPVLSEYGVVKLGGDRADRRREHWQKIAIGACEQCGRTRPPTIDRPIALNDWFGKKTGTNSSELILVPGSLDKFADLSLQGDDVRLLIGPEGGFSPKERDDANVAGFQAVSLGRRILRTETAALAALTVVQARHGDLA